MTESACHYGAVTTMDNSTLLDAADAYDTERSRWGLRYNKSFSPARHEVFRRDDDNGDPVVQASTTGSDTAINELEGMRAIAAMKAAGRWWHVHAVGETERDTSEQSDSTTSEK